MKSRGSAVPRRAAKSDSNKARLLKVVVALGGTWFDYGFLDGFVWHHRCGWVPVEIKQAHRKGTKNEFTDTQQEFMAWAGVRLANFFVWYDEADVIRDLGGSL